MYQWANLFLYNLNEKLDILQILNYKLIKTFEFAIKTRIVRFAVQQM